MTKPIKYLEGVIYVDDEAEIKAGNSIFSFKHGVSHAGSDNPPHEDEGQWNKLIAQSPNLSIEGIPYAEVEEDVEQLALNEFPVKGISTKVFPKSEDRYVDINTRFRSIWIAGYKAAQPKQFTQEDIDKLIGDFKHDLRVTTSDYVRQNCEGAIFGLERLKQSLTPQIESIEFGESYEKDGKPYLKVKSIKFGNYILNNTNVDNS